MIWDSLTNLSSYFKSFISNLSSDSDSESSYSEMDDVQRGDVINGLYMGGKAIPVEVLCSILKWIDEDSLVVSRLVCKQWKNVIDDYVWEEKYKYTKSLLGPRSEVQIPWWVAYWAAKKNIFFKNLIKNNCGQEQFNHWRIKYNSGDLWLVENEPHGAMDPLPTCQEIGTNKCCFVTSFDWCSKEQIINLSESGLSDKIMDTIQPDFEFSEWISARFDCGGLYGLNVCLLDKNKKLVGSIINVDKRLESGEGWEKITGTIQGPYPLGARYLWFHHKGKDTQFWKGHYGIKITGSSLKPVFPKERFLADFLASAPPLSSP